MKIVFEKFYKHSTADGEELLATSSALPPGKAVRVSETAFAIVDLPADLTTLVEMTREEWIVTKEPIGIEIHWHGDPVAAPPKRVLTPEEENLDKEYQSRLHATRAARMQAIRQALADQEYPLVEVETKTITSYSSVPLAAALGQFLAPDPDPVDPISWRRAAGEIDKLSLVSSLIEAIGPIVSGITGSRVSVNVPTSAKKV